MTDDDDFRWRADEHRYTRLARIALLETPSLRTYENEDDLALAISRAVGAWFAERGIPEPKRLKK
jgi:hypothetical protein